MSPVLTLVTSVEIPSQRGWVDIHVARPGSDPADEKDPPDFEDSAGRHPHPLAT
jgi:hypothetical protein